MCFPTDRSVISEVSFIKDVVHSAKHGNDTVIYRCHLSCLLCLSHQITATKLPVIIVALHPISHYWKAALGGASIHEETVMNINNDHGDLACLQGSMLPAKDKTKPAKDKTNRYDARVGILVVFIEIENPQQYFIFCFVSVRMDTNFHCPVDRHTRTHDSPSMQVTSAQELSYHDCLLQHGCS